MGRACIGPSRADGGHEAEAAPWLTGPNQRTTWGRTRFAAPAASPLVIGALGRRTSPMTDGEVASLMVLVPWFLLVGQA